MQLSIHNGKMLLLFKATPIDLSFALAFIYKEFNNTYSISIPLLSKKLYNTEVKYAYCICPSGEYFNGQLIEEFLQNLLYISQKYSEIILMISEGVII